MDNEPGIVCDCQGATCLISLSGRITVDDSPELRALLLQQLQAPACRSLTVDLHQAEYVDTSVLAILVEVLKAARGLGKAFRLSRLQGRPRYLLEATRLIYLFGELEDEARPGDSAAGSPQ